MHSDWRSDIVDLTLDCDDSDDFDDVPPSLTTGLTIPSNVPLPGVSRPPKAQAPTARPKTSSANVPLLGSAPQSHTSEHAFPKHMQTLNGIIPPPDHSRPSSAASTSRNGTKSFVPAPALVSANARANNGGYSEPLVKRRKLSTPGRQIETATQGLSLGPEPSFTGRRLAYESGQTRNDIAAQHRKSDHDAFSQPDTQMSRISNMSTSPNPTNKAPSVQYMNAALKTSARTTSLVDRIAAKGPRPLQIGRLPYSNGSELPSNSTRSITPTDPIPPWLQAKPIQTPRQDHAGHIRDAYMSQATSQAESQTQPAILAAKFTSKLRAQQRSNSDLFGAASPNQDDDNDSVISDVQLPARHTQTSAPVTETARRPQPPVAPVATHISAQPKASSNFSEEEEHLLIFLKEVKKFKWKVITAEFAKDMPARLYHTLQSRYTTKTNRRDRSRDPVVLKLPPRWAAEAVINWAAVHAANPGPREQIEASNPYPSAGTAPAVAPKTAIFGQTTEQDYSSGTESGARKSRPRRAPPVNYDVRKKNGHSGADMQGTELEDDISLSADMNVDTPTRSELPSQAQVNSLATAHRVISEPLEMQFNKEDSKIGLSARTFNAADQKLPYLKQSLRLSLQNPPEEWNWDQLSSHDWQGSLLHVDLSPEELKRVLQAVANVFQTPQRSTHTTFRRHLRTVLRGISDAKRLQLVRAMGRRLPSRDRSSIEAFLDDARIGKLAEAPQILRLSAIQSHKSMSSVYNESTTSLLRQREFGCHSRRGWQTATKVVTYQTKNKLMDTLGPLSSWTGASSDIHTVAWSQDGRLFAAGAVAVTDRDSMQYNRPNNLLLGNLGDGTIHELAEHSVERERTDAGANSTHAMFVSQDPKLYTTVTSVAFARSGKLMYSAGYDESVCIWNLDSETSQPALDIKLRHKGEVEMMVVNNRTDGMLATAAKRTSGAPIKILTFDEDDPSILEKHNFHSEKAVSRSDLRILPQALRFEPRYGGLLLAGFGANVRNGNAFDLTGDLCLWDIETQTQIPIHGSNRNVFDITFNPNRRYMPLFAAGCVASTNVNKGTRSVIRLYDEKGPYKYTSPLEIECRALDMNDVVWCPQDEQIIAAGCTDGRVYVWDVRNPDDPLMTLSHGYSLMPLQDDIPHERTDTGVRFLSWGDNSTRLYSGSSDGVVKVWDVTRSAEDTFIKDLITLDSGIMAGTFSPDFSKLVLGEVNGSVSVLDVGRGDSSAKDVEKLRYVPYSGYTSDNDSVAGDPTNNSATESGVALGKQSLQHQQLKVVPMGNLPVRQVVQGTSYEGPYDRSVDAPYLREQALEFQLSMATTTGPQCSIAACQDNIIIVTSEETGDSGRSSDRIPDELRRQWTSVDATSRIVPGRSKCTHCSRPARPPASDSLDAPVLCERCSFACFRCGAVNPIAPATTTLICDTCAGVWEMGALGYECIEQPTSTGLKLDVPPLRRYGRDMLLERFDASKASFGDELNALTDYYHSLAIDRPESPPL